MTVLTQFSGFKQNKIRILFFADTHLGFDYPVRPKVKRRRRGQDFFDNYQRILTYAADSQVDLVIHGGDFFFRSRIPKKIVDLAYEPLFEFAEHGIPFFIVPGNHERSELPTSLYLAHPNIHVFDRPKTYVIDLRAVRVSISGFPCERNGVRDRFTSLLAASGWQDHSTHIKFLCMHQAIEGAQVGPSNYTFRYGKDVIRLADLPTDFHAVLSGHIHRKQVLARRMHHNVEMPIIYPGSTERTSFAERGEEKGFFEITLRLAADNSWKIHHLKFIELPTRPMEDLYLDGSVNKSNLRSYLLAKISQFSEDAIVRLKCNGNIDEHVKQLLTSRFLRDVFPQSMNFQVGSDFFRTYKPNKLI